MLFIVSIGFYVIKGKFDIEVFIQIMDYFLNPTSGQYIQCVVFRLVCLFRFGLGKS